MCEKGAEHSKTSTGSLKEFDNWSTLKDRDIIFDMDKRMGIVYIAGFKPFHKD